MTPLSLLKVECMESSDTYGRFAAEPLDRGSGITLGNALRRVLLSSLPGAAVTWIKIERVQHEFSTIPHMKEDTIDFLLNVKALRLRPLTNRPGKLILEVEGEGEVHAADIKPSADFEIVNPELHLATLDSPEAKLYVEFNVEIGKGYIPAGSSDGLPLGAIPVDAIFSPVRRVNFSIEPVRLGQESSQERLILEVWTDCTISPVEAISQGCGILIEQLSTFRELIKVPTLETALSWRQILSPEKYNIPLEQLNLSTRTYNSLKRGGITTLGQLLEKSREGLLSLPGFGVKSQEELEKVLKELRLPLPVETKKKKKEQAASKSVPSEAEVIDET